MDMMLVLGILASVFFVSLTLICFYREHINTKIFNIVFVILDIVFYFIWNIGMYHQGWLEKGFQTLGNISPMIFTVIPLTVFMSDKVKEYAFSAIAFLWVGMFIALFISPEYSYVFNYKTAADIQRTGEALCHMLASLMGIYLILTGQVKTDWKSLGKAIVFMYSVIGFGVLLNFFFHKSNFQMDPYGGASIYFLDLFGTFEATFIAYLLGVMVVLFLGWQFGMLLEFLCVKVQKERLGDDMLNHDVVYADDIPVGTPKNKQG
ncbi:MAG: hypothetical protein IKB20_00440 [Clostridia bacterium]|nr:hypothetical protein [Clostridia bacterium]